MSKIVKNKMLKGINRQKREKSVTVLVNKQLKKLLVIFVTKYRWV
jgi:hypothetical protein